MKVKLIGTGHIASHHAEAIATWPDLIELQATDLSDERLTRFTERYSECRPFESADALLADAEHAPSLVAIATPPSAHHELLLRALRAGCHVLCEKPLLMNRSQLDEVFRAAKQADRHVFCCSNRFLGEFPIQELRRLVDDHAFGELYRVSWSHLNQRSRTGIDYLPETMSWAIDPRVSGGGVLMDWGPYDLACLNYILRPAEIEVRQARLATPRAAAPKTRGVPDQIEVEFHAMAWLRATRDDGAVVDIFLDRASCTHGPPHECVRFEGTTAAASARQVFGGPQANVVLCRDENGQAIENPWVGEPVHGEMASRPLHGALATLSGDGSWSIKDAQAWFNFAVLRAIYACAADGKAQHVRLADYGGL